MNIAKDGKITFTKNNAKYILIFINKYINIIITYLLPLRKISFIDNRIKDYIKKNNIKGNTINYLYKDNVKEFINS